ncbi:disease resistance CC-NBS-LRR class family protein [Tanacetum coccineum]
MSNIKNLKFPALNITGENYIQWTGYVKRHLKSMGALATIQEGNECTEEIKAKADVFLHQYIDEMLEFEYSSYIDPSILFCGQTVTEADMLEKTFSTFHASNINLQQQYRLQNFKRYYDLNVNLLVAEKNNELLMKNHQNRPTGSLAIPEANAVENNDNRNSGNKRGRGNPRGHGRGRGHYGHNRFSNPNYSYHLGGNNGRGRGRDQKNYTYHAPQINNFKQKNNEVGTSQNTEGMCFRCGSANHWSKTCRTPLHLCELYQASRKGKEKEVNHVDQFDNTNTQLVTEKKFDDIVKRVRLDNAGEFTSHAFNDYCMSGIIVEHSVAHVHTQNGLAKSLIKRLQLIARPLIMRTKLPVSMWGHAILHAASLIRMRPSANHKYSPIQLASGQEPNISHLIIFGFAVYVPIAPPQRTKMGPQMRLGIYVGYETSSIIRYIEPLTDDLFTTRFADCHFDEAVFSELGGVKRNKEKDFTWCEPFLCYMYPRTKQCETEVQKIMHLQEIANQLPDAFTDTKRVTKSHVPTANAPARVEIPNKQVGDNIAQGSQKRLKRRRPIGSKDKNHRKRKGTEKNSDNDENVLNKTQDIKTSPEEAMNDINKKMSINYSQTQILWDQNEIGDIDEIFSYSVASDIMCGDDDPEPKSVIDCQRRPDWVKWKDAMQAELNSLNKLNVFGHIVTTPRNVKPIGYRWIFVQKRNEKNEVTRYKARLVAQGFSQRPGIDYEETYSPVMDAITFSNLISLAVSKNLETRLMDDVTAYLYGSIDNDIYMKVPEGFKIPDSLGSKPKEMYSIKLKRSLYGLKQSGRMWYNRLSDYLISKRYKSNLICPCVFIKKTTSGFVIIAVYVDDLNIIGTSKEINEVIVHLKKEFEMKDLGKTKYCLGLQIEHMPNGILVHQSNYTEKVLKCFNMDKAKSLSTLMVGRSLNVDNDPFRPCEEDEDILGPKTSYLSAIGVLMYLTNCTRPDISFAVNLLARFSSSPTKRHWNGIKHIFRYLRGTTDLGLFYSNNSKQRLVGYVDAGYLSDPHKARSQTGYVFLNKGIAISWRSQKQTLVATSSNHAEVIALHEASRECVWLRSMTQLIVTSCGLNKEKSPTIIYEDNAACVTQIKEGYIKSDRTKLIPPRYFAYTQDLIKDNQIEMKYVQSSNNSADLFTKSLLTSVFRKHVHAIGMRHVQKT